MYIVRSRSLSRLRLVHFMSSKAGGKGHLFDKSAYVSRLEHFHFHEIRNKESYGIAIVLALIYGYYSDAESSVRSEPLYNTQTKDDEQGSSRFVPTLRRMRSLPAKSLSDRYNVDWTTKLGEGAYGSVHPARLAITGEKVALKKMSKRYTNKSSFRSETDALMRIYNNGGHPNISGLREVFEDQDYYYLVMDLVSGGEMFDHLIEYGAYSEADAARLMQEVASALAFLHGVGVIHADLKVIYLYITMIQDDLQ